MARGVDGRTIYMDDHDRRGFLQTTLAIKSETPFTILAYCLMDNHFHFAIKAGNIPLSKIMQRLLTAYVMGFNARHGREGHLFQARFKSVLCLDDAYFSALIGYIHKNPVRAGLVKRPSDWPWSSHQDYAGKPALPLADTRLFFELMEHSVDFKEWSESTDDAFEPWPETGIPPPLLREETEPGQSLDDLASGLFPDAWAAIKSGSRQRAVSRKKTIFAEKALLNGHSLTSIATWTNCTPAAIHHLLKRNK